MPRDLRGQGARGERGSAAGDSPCQAGQGLGDLRCHRSPGGVGAQGQAGTVPGALCPCGVVGMVPCILHGCVALEKGWGTALQALPCAT